MKYIIHNADGLIIRTGFCSERDFDRQAQEGELIIEGSANDDKQYISDGIICDYSEEELEEKRNVPYGYKWKMPERIVEKVVEDEEINRHASERAMADRTARLAASDWAMTTDAPTDKQAWLLYRHALRDVPQQAGFPLNIEWPEMPA
jgi:hypothetical protein